MMGPASGGLQVFTLRRKARKGVGYSGTPWSGHAVNWNWRTSRFSLEPFWREQRGGSDMCCVLSVAGGFYLCHERNNATGNAAIQKGDECKHFLGYSERLLAVPRKHTSAVTAKDLLKNIITCRENNYILFVQKAKKFVRVVCSYHQSWILAYHCFCTLQKIPTLQGRRLKNSFWCSFA